MNVIVFCRSEEIVLDERLVGLVCWVLRFEVVFVELLVVLIGIDEVLVEFEGVGIEEE